MDKQLRYVQPESHKVLQNLSFPTILLWRTKYFLRCFQSALNDDELHEEVLEIVEKKVDDLQERGVDNMPEKDFVTMRKKLQLISNRFNEFKKPQGYFLIKKC